MSKIELIIEGSLNDNEENLLKSLATIKYKIPLIESLVIEVEENNINKLRNLKCLKTVFHNTHITMQMNTARNSVNANIAQEKGFTGKGIGIAILDTGISPTNDFIRPKNRLIAFKDFINNRKEPYDDNGHGTHVSGIAGGNGINSNGKYKGIAPECNLIGIKVLNNEGKGNVSDVLAGLQWIIDNKEKYNIKVINLSIGTNNTSSNDPLVKAVEKAWDLGLVITIAAGNNGPNKSTISSPGISRKVITIGASDDNKSTKVWGNTLINFSGRGPTLECIVKPDVLAPGVNIVSCLPSTVSKQSKDLDVIDKNYFSLSGTSMSTPIVTGAIALLLQKHDTLKPDDVKLMLKKCCIDLNLPKNQQGWGFIDVNKLLSQEVCYARK